MRPIKLELTGLNSYIDKATIDFDKLTERGLFGIFGKTGSGKSTILDAMTIAMYGNIPRNTKEFINSSCDKAIISYEFEIGSKNAKRKYKVDRTIVRTNTGTKTSYARLIEIYNDKTENVLADKVGEVNNKIADIVGLTSNDFMRSVVLPQGKFNDFLKLAGSDRRDMLERIFNLEKYGRGLIEKVRKRKSTQLQGLSDIKSKLSQYDNINEKLYDEIEKELEKLKELELKINKDFEESQNQYKKYEKIYENQTNLEKNIARKKELDSISDEISKKIRKLEDSINAEKINPYIDSLLDLEKRVNEDAMESEKLEKKSEVLNKELIITKANYEQAYKDRNEKMPKLSEDKTKLQKAIELEVELKQLESELVKVKESGVSLAKDKEIFIKSKGDLESKKDVILNNIKTLEEKINALKISAELKQKIFLAYDYEKEYNKILENKNIKSNKLDELNKNIEQLNLNIRYVQRDKEVVTKKLQDLQNYYEILLGKSPGTNDEVVSKTEYITNLKVKVDVIKENEIKKDVIQENLNKILENKHQSEREIISLNDKLGINKKNIDYLKKELEEFKYLNLANELRKELKENMPCPVCGSRHHENVENKNYDESIAFTSEKLEKLIQEESKINEKLEQENRKNSECISVEKIRLKELEEVKAKIGDFNSNELINKLEEESRKLDILKVNIQNWSKDKEETEVKITKTKEEKNKIEKDELKQQESINSYKKSIKELKEEIDTIELIFNKAKNDYLGLKTIVKVQDLGLKVDEINKNEKIIEDFNSEYLKLTKTKEDIEKELLNCQSNLHNIELELMQAREVYSEKKKVRDDKYKEMIGITKGESPQVIINNLESLINKLISQEETIKEKLESQRVEYEKVTSEKSNIDGRLKIAKEQYNTQSKTLNNSLQEYKFENIYAVKRALLEKVEQKNLHEEITKYEEEQKILIVKINDLKMQLGEDNVKEEVFNELKKKIYDLKVEIGRISKEIGSKQNTLQNLKEGLEKVKDLNKELKIAQHKVDLLDDLDKVVQGNRFVEYVATNQLKYIALEASKRLESITKGRYALEIDSTLNFVMRDNFNGGQRRSVDTLSGGETFLTSLSLALALSSQIQLKGSAPLEFFFLDEGFGSLDSDLLETVIESLERLHNDKLSVGIITHVEDLKNRVPVKLIVSPSDVGQGSKVKIEYS